MAKSGGSSGMGRAEGTVQSRSRAMARAELIMGNMSRSMTNYQIRLARAELRDLMDKTTRSNREIIRRYLLSGKI